MDTLLGSTGIRHPHPSHTVPRLTRFRARWCAHRLDMEIDRGARIRAGSLLAAHALQITSFDEREHLARSLRAVTRRHHRFSVPVDHEAVLSNAALIDQVALRLHAVTPVRVRGMARLRLLLSDGRGPLYGPGRGSLAAELRGVLAALQ